jgi:hypothetical protein
MFANNLQKKSTSPKTQSPVHLINTYLSDIAGKEKHFNHRQHQNLSCFEVIFSQTALKTRKPCTQGVIKRVGLFYAKVREC